MIRILWARGAVIALALLLNLHPSRLGGQGVPLEWRQVHLGLEVTIRTWADSVQAGIAVDSAFATIARLESILSDWRATSDLRRLSDLPAGRWHDVAPDLAAVLSLALEFAEASEGAFDPTIGSLTQLWREQRRTGVAPDSSTIAAARSRVDWRKVHVDTVTNRVLLDDTNLQFDLGAIAKGWILDRALEAMRRVGISSAMIEAGGDMVGAEGPPDSGGWRIAYAAANEIVILRNNALAVSGPSQQAVTDPDGTIRSHVIDPVSGRGLDSRTEVVIRARSGAIADATATTLTLLPRARWPGILERFGATLIAVYSAAIPTN
jgi:thiamine biosynthesis lipoprotein